MFQLPPNIDPGEAVSAVVGVRPILEDKFQRISAPQWTQIGNFDKTIKNLARDLVRGDLDQVTAKPIDYDAYLAALSSDKDEATIAAIGAQFPPDAHDAQTAYLAQIGKTLRFLRGKLPISTCTSLFGVDNLPPSDTQIFAFEDLLDVADQPLSVFSMIDSGRLTSDMALALMQLSPSLYAAILKAIVLRCTHERGQQGSAWDPQFEPALAVLLAVPGVDPTLRQQLQAPKPQQPNGQPAPEPNSNTQEKRLAPQSAQASLNNS